MKTKVFIVIALCLMACDIGCSAPAAQLQNFAGDYELVPRVDGVAVGSVSAHGAAFVGSGAVDIEFVFTDPTTRQSVTLWADRLADVSLCVGARIELTAERVRLVRVDGPDVAATWPSLQVCSNHGESLTTRGESRTLYEGPRDMMPPDFPPPPPPPPSLE